jgi:hypothetical protein
MLHERKVKMFGEDVLVTFENFPVFEECIVLEAKDACGEDFIEKYGIDLVTQVLFDLLEEESNEP